MANNLAESVQIPLEVFGGYVSEMSPPDVPEGISPDCSDVVFSPGNVATRGGLRKVLATPVSGAPNFTYAKSYTDPTGRISNLYLDSNGVFYVESLDSAPGVLVPKFSTAPGSYCKSVSAFGREYLAISDGLHGVEPPLQFDGVNIDRVTQDGPGTPPIVTALTLPAVPMAVTGTLAPVAITSAYPSNQVTTYTPPNDSEYGGGGSGTTTSYYTGLTVNVTDASNVAGGQSITIAGNSNPDFNGNFLVQSITGNTITFGAYFPSGEASGTGGTVALGGGITASRSGNVVTVNTAAPHGLKIGYQAQITGLPASSVGGGIASITINNENNPGLALVTTNTAHGMVPGLSVSLSGINATAVGGGISSLSRAGGVVTVTTNTAHGISPGSSVTIAGSTASGTPSTSTTTGSTNTTTTNPPLTNFNTTASVLSTNSPTVFTFAQTDNDATGTGGTVTINWPVPTTATPTYFTVDSAPSTTSFYVQVNYSDGSWTGGTATYAWDGTFFVSDTPDDDSFTYQQYGPNASTATVGKVTPYGQIAPGKHQVSVCFLTRQGYLTKPSPSVTFIANGGQYVSITDIPIGSSNIVARVLCFTGAAGDYFYYIAAPAQINGQTISSATQLNDNITTAAVLDFADVTLYRAQSIDTPGNQLANQIILDGALGFDFYSNRLVVCGMRNKIQNLLNMSFDGGYIAGTTTPTGWTPLVTGAAGMLTTGRFGQGWQITTTPNSVIAGGLAQSFFLDSYGAPIGQPNTQYTLRVWLKPSALASDLTFVVVFANGNGFSDGVQIKGTAMSLAGSYVTGTFQGVTPPDMTGMTINVYAVSTSMSVTLLVDEIQICYAGTPYLDTILYGSYGDNPEAFDGVSGKFGPSTDTHKVMCSGEIRSTLYLLTRDPGGRIHEVQDSGTSEPAGWSVQEVATRCGAVSAYCLTSGEEWLSWVSLNGARIFGGPEAWKISQEIQADWSGGLNANAALTCWAVNDTTERVIYYGLPIGTATAPSIIYVMDYRELQTAEQIAQSSPIHTSMTGRLISTDHVRKWAPWKLACNGAAMMHRVDGNVAFVLFSGIRSGNLYTLDPSKLTDDDYGQIISYYTTYFFPSHDAEQALKLGSARKELTYLTASIYGAGNVTITPLLGNPNNPCPIVCNSLLSATIPNYDLPWSFSNVVAERIGFRIQASPLPGTTDCAFTLSKLMPAFKPAKRSPVRGSAY